MTPNDMSYEQAREYILANYFDGDDDVKAVTGGDEETIAMAKAVDAIDELDRYHHSMFVIGETCVDASKRHITAEAALAKIRKNIYFKRKDI